MVARKERGWSEKEDPVEREVGGGRTVLCCEEIEVK
jgi:hypothetical protein